MASDHHINIFFESKALDKETFKVVRFEGEEEISRPYRFVVDLVSDDPDVDLDATLGRPACLSFQRGDDGPLRKVHGVLSDIELGREGQHGHYFYRAVLVPRLWMMSLTQQNQIYQNKTIPEIVEEELKGSKGKGPAGNSTFDFAADDFEFRLSGSYPQKEYLVQYGESDLDFISRLLEHVGIYYFFQQGEDRERIIFCDANVHLPHVPGESSFPYALPSGTSASMAESVQFLSSRRSQITDKVLLKDYNYRTPMTPLQAGQDVEGDGYGVVCQYGDHFKTPEEGQGLAQVRAEEIRSSKEIYQGEGDCQGFTAGHLFQLDEHFKEALNQVYVLTTLRHFGAQASSEALGFGEGEDGQTTSYRNEFQAIPKPVAYRPPRRTAKPKLYGVMNARIDASGPGTRAEIDGEGRYKLVMPFDLSGTAKGKATRWVRMAQPYGGGQHGMHFPLLKGTEVLWSCVDGDPDRPIITGVAPNPLNKSVVNAESHTKNRIKTPSGILIEMEDGPGGRGASGSGDQQQGQSLAFEPARAQEAAADGPQAAVADSTVSMRAADRPLSEQQQMSYVSETAGDADNAATADVDETGQGRYLRMHVPQATLDAGKNNPPQTIVTKDPDFRYTGENQDPNVAAPTRPGDQPLPNNKIEAYVRMGANLPRGDGSYVSDSADPAWLPIQKEPGDELYGLPELQKDGTDVGGNPTTATTQDPEPGLFDGFVDNVSEGNDDNEGNPSRADEASKAKFRNGVVWRDHVSGNRLSTTQGDKVEIISGNYRQVLCNSKVSVDAVNGTWRNGSNVPGNVSFKWTETGEPDGGGAMGNRTQATWGTTEVTRNGWTKNDYEGYQEDHFKGTAKETFTGKRESHSLAIELETEASFGAKFGAFWGVDARYSGGIDLDWHDSLGLEIDNDWRYVFGVEGEFKHSLGQTYEVIKEQDLIASDSIMLQVNTAPHNALAQWAKGLFGWKSENGKTKYGGGAALAHMIPMAGFYGLWGRAKDILEGAVETGTLAGRATIELQQDDILLSVGEPPTGRPRIELGHGKISMIVGTTSLVLDNAGVTIKGGQIKLNPPGP